MNGKVSYDGRPVLGGISVDALKRAFDNPGQVIMLQTDKGRASFTVIKKDADGRGWLTCTDPALFCRRTTKISFVFAKIPTDTFLGYLHINR